MILFVFVHHSKNTKWRVNWPGSSSAERDMGFRMNYKMNESTMW